MALVKKKIREKLFHFLQTCSIYTKEIIKMIITASSLFQEKFYIKK